jgi:hypothetical protein
MTACLPSWPRRLRWSSISSRPHFARAGATVTPITTVGGGVRGPVLPGTVYLGRPSPDLEWGLVRPEDVQRAIAHGWHVGTFTNVDEQNAAHQREDAPSPSETGS